MSKISEWLILNRKPIGYTGAAANLILAAVFAFFGDTGLALIWTVLGITLAFNTYELD